MTSAFTGFRQRRSLAQPLGAMVFSAIVREGWRSVRGSLYTGGRCPHLACDAFRWQFGAVGTKWCEIGRGDRQAVMDQQRRKPYWRETKTLVGVVLLLPGAAMISLPFWVERVAAANLFGFPLPFLLAGNGVAVLALAAVGWFAAKQDEIDHWHGAHEDDR
jgi:putative solute:sodium symporter small subunit